jgi:hypothetical protein
VKVLVTHDWTQALGQHRDERGHVPAHQHGDHEDEDRAGDCGEVVIEVALDVLAEQVPEAYRDRDATEDVGKRGDLPDHLLDVQGLDQAGLDPGTGGRADDQ